MIMFKYWEDHVNKGGKHIFQFQVNKLDERTYRQRTGLVMGTRPPNLYELQLTGKILDKQTGQLKSISYRDAGFTTESEFKKYKTVEHLKPEDYLPEENRQDSNIPVLSWYFLDEDSIVQACIKKRKQRCQDFDLASLFPTASNFRPARSAHALDQGIICRHLFRQIYPSPHIFASAETMPAP